MFNMICSGLLFLLTLTACGTNNTPSRQNDFTPLTSMEIVPPPPIAVNTSTKLTVIGNFSGLFKRDITDEVTWATSAPTVADFSFPTVPARVKGVAPGGATLTATRGTVKASTGLTVTNATINTVTVTPVNPSVPLGLTAQFSASGAFSDGTTQDLTFDAAWLSSAPAIATVSDLVTSKGLAHTVTLGSTTISATFPAVGGTSGSSLLTVTTPALKTITVTPANSSILSLSTTTFKANGLYTDGKSADITDTVTWTSSQTSVATMAAGGAATSLAQGSSTVSASLNGVSGSAILKVTGGTLTGFTLAPAAITLANGTVSRISATGTFNNGTTRDITGKLSWASANPLVATVTAPSGNLVLTQAVATAPAQTTITGTLGALSAATIVTATTPASLSTLTISPVSTVLTVGASSRFTLSGTFSDGTSQDLTTSAAWTSANTSAATAGDTGLDKGWAKGVGASAVPINITATFGGLQISAAATVSSRILQGISTAGLPTSFVPGTQSNLIVTATYSDGTKDVTKDAVFSIDNSNVLIQADSVNQPGTIVIVDSGKAVLTVSFGGLVQTFTITVP